MYDATDLAIADLERAGVDVIADGEMRRLHVIQGFYRYVSGLTVVPPSRRLVANARLIAPAALARDLRLTELFDARVDLSDAPGRAQVGDKATAVIHSVLAGADSIDGCELLRAGATQAVLGHWGRLRRSGSAQRGDRIALAVERYRLGQAGGVVESLVVSPSDRSVPYYERAGFVRSLLGLGRQLDS